MSQGMHKLNGFEIPRTLVEAFGPFEEFKQDASIVNLHLQDGRTFKNALLLYPNHLVAIENQTTLPFAVEDIESIEQTPDNLLVRTTSKWSFLPNSFITRRVCRTIKHAFSLLHSF